MSDTSTKGPLAMTIKELDDDCACGGGAISGHATGCPEAARFASPPSPAPAESGAVAWYWWHNPLDQAPSWWWGEKRPDHAPARAKPLYDHAAPSASMGRVTPDRVTEIMVEPFTDSIVLLMTGEGETLSAILDTSYAVELRDKLSAALRSQP